MSATDVTRRVEVHPMSGQTGAEISGVDLTKSLEPSQVEEIRQALNRWKVVFFRDQFMDHAQHIAFARSFGELTYAHPFEAAPLDGYPEIYTVDTRRVTHRFGYDLEAFELERKRRYSYFEGWHTDVTPAVNPPSGSILRADIVPSVGGDTHFTNLVAAYEGLSEPVKRLVDGLRAEHFYGARQRGAAGVTPAQAFTAKDGTARLVAHHPVVRVHPLTGERALFVNPGFTDHIVGVSPHESRWILDHLFQELVRPEYTMRFRWFPGSVAFWDNRATAHMAPNDVPPDVERVLHRVTLVGDVPIGPDGRPSELISGAPMQANSHLAAD